MAYQLTDALKQRQPDLQHIKTPPVGLHSRMPVCVCVCSYRLWVFLTVLAAAWSGIYIPFALAFQHVPGL